jgi:hypothetical protein
MILERKELVTYLSPHWRAGSTWVAASLGGGLLWASAGGGWVVVTGSGGCWLRASLSDGHGGSAGRLVTLDSENLVVVVGSQAIAMLATVDIHVS